MLRAKYFSTALSFTAIFDSGYRGYRLYRGCGLLGMWAFLGEDLGVEVRGKDGCYCFFEGGYFCFYGFVFV